jgi:hypothetical protein
MGLVERVKLHYGGFIERRIEKKYENVMRPVYLPKYDKWVVDTEIQRKRRQSSALNKKERESIPGAETGDIIWVLGEFARTGLSYRFWTASARKSIMSMLIGLVKFCLFWLMIRGILKLTSHLGQTIRPKNWNIFRRFKKNMQRLIVSRLRIKAKN